MIDEKAKVKIPPKLIHGWDTDKEWLAYEQGRKDEAEVLTNWISNWDGKTDSAAGEIFK